MKTDPYTGPWPRKRHSHTCQTCKRRGQGAVACYKQRCSRPQSVETCACCYSLDRTRIGNTPTCENCGKAFDHCTCDEDEAAAEVENFGLVVDPAEVHADLALAQLSLFVKLLKL